MDILIHVLDSIWETALQMAPWLLFGFFAAGVLSLLISPESVCRFLGRAAGKRAIALAVAVGVPLPLCSCGVLPVAASLKRQGASKSAVAAFLISTPQTGVDSFFATGSLLGWCFALLRPFVATLTGFLGGFVIQTIDQEENASNDVANGPKAQTAKTFLEKIIAVFTYGYGTLLKGVAPALFVGLLLSALIMVFIPERFFDETFLGNDWVAFPIMLLIGMPMYVCSTASIPVALSLMAKGISPGAALIFLIVGPALNGASLAMLLQILGKKCLFVYLLIISGASILSGIVLNWLAYHWQILPDYTVNTMVGCTSGCASTAIIKVACAVILFGLLLWHLVLRRIVQRKRSNQYMDQVKGNTHRVTVKGMRCDHCRGLVNRLLSDYETVTCVTPAGADSFDVVGELPETLGEDLRKLGFDLDV